MSKPALHDTWRTAAFQIATIGLSLAALHTAPAFADDYPNRPVRMILTVSPGGAMDATARILAKHLTEMTKQNYLVESKPGVSGMVAMEYENTQKPDGYTLLYSADTTAIAPWLVPHHEQAVAMVQELTPITYVGIAPYVFMVNPKIPAKNPPELVDYIKQHPDFKWSIGGIGVPGQLALGRFIKLAGIPVGQQIPYKGVAPALLAVLTGEVDGTVSQPPGMQENIAAGKLKAIAVASLQPNDSLPGVPTFASFGYKDFDAESWFGIWGPKGMSPALAKQVRDQIAQVTKDPDFVKEFARAGFSTTVSDSPEAFGKYFKEELAKDGALLKDLGIKPEDEH